MTRWPQMVSELFTVELSVWGKGVSVMTRSLQQPLASHGRDQWSRCRPPPGPGFASSRPPQELKHVPQCVYRFLSRTSGRWRCRISELITAFSSLRCFTLHWSVTQTFFEEFFESESGQLDRVYSLVYLFPLYHTRGQKSLRIWIFVVADWNSSKHFLIRFSFD